MARQGVLVMFSLPRLLFIIIFLVISSVARSEPDNDGDGLLDKDGVPFRFTYSAWTTCSGMCRETSSDINSPPPAVFFLSLFPRLL